MLVYLRPTIIEEYAGDTDFQPCPLPPQIYIHINQASKMNVLGYKQDGAQTVTGRVDGCLAGRMESCILNGSAQDEAKSLASTLVAGRMKAFIF
jgi:hypothetical protein